MKRSGPNSVVQHDEPTKGSTHNQQFRKKNCFKDYPRQKKVYHSAFLAGREGEVGALGRSIFPAKAP